MLAKHPLERAPGEGGDGSSESGRREGLRGDTIRSESRSRIKAVPTNPEHARTNHTQHHRVRRHWHFAETCALADQDTEQEGRPA